MLVIPDTNWLIYAVKYRLWHELRKLYPRYSLLILPQVAHELAALTKKAKGKDKEAAALALSLVQNLGVKKRAGHADTAIFQVAKWLKDVHEKNFVIATMDKALKKRLKKVDIKILIIRQKRYLVEQ